MQSWMDLDLRKPYGFLWIHVRITLCSLFAKSLVRNLRQVFVREIGLKSLKLSGESFFGIRVIRKQQTGAWKTLCIQLADFSTEVVYCTAPILTELP